ncbi:MAG: Methylated-DNA--protein-cysteine methyltransferase, partial [uncultured Nocardioidaceae bacterium]
DPLPHRPRQPARPADRRGRGRPPRRPVRRAGSRQGARAQRRARGTVRARGRPAAAGGGRPAGGVLPRRADGLRPARRSRRDAVPAAGVGRAAPDPLRRDPQLRAARRGGRQPRCQPRGRCGERPEPRQHRRPLPSRGGQQRTAHRLLRRPVDQGDVAHPRAPRGRRGRPNGRL